MAAKEAGISHTQGNRYDKDEDVQDAYKLMIREAIPATKLVELIKEGCEATIPVYNLEGKIATERPDWKNRKPFIEMAREDAGYVDTKLKGQAGTLINVVVQHIGTASSRASSLEQRGSILQITAEADSSTQPV